MHFLTAHSGTIFRERCNGQRPRGPISCSCLSQWDFTLQGLNKLEWGLWGCLKATDLYRINTWLWVKTNGIPFWAFRCTTHFRTYFSGDWDVHWGYRILTHGHIGIPNNPLRDKSHFHFHSPTQGSNPRLRASWALFL